MNKQQITAQRQKTHAKLIKLKSKVYHAFLQMEQAAKAGATMEEVLEAVELGIEMGAVRPQSRPGSP